MTKTSSDKKEEVKKTKKKEEVIEEPKKKEQSTLVSLLELLAIILVIIGILVFLPHTTIWNIVVLLLMLTVLIFVHEGGHFLMGKKFGVYIYEFAIGMGPKVLGFKRKNDPTEYNLRMLPIGGYCQLAGEEGEDDENLSKDQFMCNKNKIPRIIILVAGVTMNFITAFLLLFFISLIWGSTDQSNTIGSVTENSPAYEAGIVEGDKILKLNGHKINKWDDISLVSSLKNDKDYLEYDIKHKDGSIETIKITPTEYVEITTTNDNDIISGVEYVKITEEKSEETINKEYGVDEDEHKTSQVKTIVGIGSNSKIQKGFMVSLKYAWVKFWSLATMMVQIIWYLITGKLSLDALSGPVGMYTVVNTVSKYGLANIIYLMAYLSVNLGVMNILPFPAFDGGRVLFVIIEAITRKKVDSKVENWFHTVGFILLMILMLYITLQDIIKLF